MRPTSLSFSIRTDKNIGFDEMRTRIEAALSITLHEGDYHNIPVHQGKTLGMTILFLTGLGIGRMPNFQLIGLVDDSRFTKAAIVDGPMIPIDINQAVIDLLALSGAGTWRVPSSAERDAEAQHAAEEERSFESTENGPDFREDDEGDQPL